MPQKYEQFTPQLLPPYWRSPKMRFMNVNGGCLFVLFRFPCQTVMKPLKQEAMVLVWLCLFITHTYTQSPKVQAVSSSAGLWTNNPSCMCEDTTATQMHMQRSPRQNISDMVVLVFFLEHPKFWFRPRRLSTGLSLRRSGFDSQLPLFGLLRQLQVQV